MVGWHHGPNGHESEQTLGDGEGQGSLLCSGPWGCKESDTTWQLNNNQIEEQDRIPVQGPRGQNRKWHEGDSCVGRERAWEGAFG